MNILDLRPGITETDDYKAFKFPGGEVHFKFKGNNLFYNEYPYEKLQILTRISNSDELILLMLVVDTFRKDGFKGIIEVVLPYMPYQQADRNFDVGECFSLQTICKLLNTLQVDTYTIFDAHSDVSPALLKNCQVIDNSEFIEQVIYNIQKSYKPSSILEKTLCILSPDAGAYKKVGKLLTKLNWRGNFEQANKNRNISSGKIEDITFSTTDFQGKNILIIDDICVGGRTFIELAKKLRERNVGKIYLAISHGIFSNGFGELMNHLDGIFTTDSFQDLYLDEKEDFINQINLKL